MNRLGEKGLYTAESKRKMKQDQIDRTGEGQDLQAQVEAFKGEGAFAFQNGESSQKANEKMEVAKDDLNNAGIKGQATRKKASKEDSGPQKTKRKRASNFIKEEEDDEESYDVKPTKRSRTKKVKKEEETDLVKEESDHEPVRRSAPKKRAGRGKKVVKEESPDDETNHQESDVTAKRNVKKSKGKPVVKEETFDLEEYKTLGSERQETKSADQPKRRRGQAIKKQTSAAQRTNLAGGVPTRVGKSPPNLSAGAALSHISGVKDSVLHDDFDRAVDAGEIEDGSEAYAQERKAAPQPKKKRSRGKRS